MKKRIISLALSIAAFAASGTLCTARTMYAPDGRTVDAVESEVSMWQANGWYDYPVMMIYSANGVSFPIAERDAGDWLGGGWYAYPVVTIYSADGASFPVAKRDLADWLALGWYDYPVMRMYCTGRQERGCCVLRG